MSFSVGETVVIRGTLAVVVETPTVAGQEFAGVVPKQAIQYVPASQVNLPTPSAPPGPGGPAPASTPPSSPGAPPPPPPPPPPPHPSPRK